jgi:hypothetical protein
MFDVPLLSGFASVIAKVTLIALPGPNSWSRVSSAEASSRGTFSSRNRVHLSGWVHGGYIHRLSDVHLMKQMFFLTLPSGNWPSAGTRLRHRPHGGA